MAASQRAADFIHRLRINSSVIHQQLEGLTDADLLLQPAFRGNCANWVLGHITGERGYMLDLLGVESLIDKRDYAMYERDSAPITGPDSPHLPMARLLADFDAAGTAILALFEAITDETLAMPAVDDRALGYMLNFIIWHEAYHVGQFEYLRQITGVDDKVI
jgi:hypothetical protein